MFWRFVAIGSELGARGSLRPVACRPSIHHCIAWRRPGGSFAEAEGSTEAVIGRGGGEEFGSDGGRRGGGNRGAGEGEFDNVREAVGIGIGEVAPEGGFFGGIGEIGGGEILAAPVGDG